MIAHNPLHGSGRAALPHPALALGDDAHAAQGLTRLNTRPARSPSTPSLRAAPHDSGPMWVATSHSYDFFHSLHLAGLTGAQEKRNENQGDQRIRG